MRVVCACIRHRNLNRRYILLIVTRQLIPQIAPSMRAQQFPLRMKRSPSEGMLSVGLHALPPSTMVATRILWEQQFAPSKPSVTPAPSVAKWRFGYGEDPNRMPMWWLNRQLEPPPPLRLTPEMQASVNGVIGQLKIKLAQNLSRCASR